MEPIKAEIRFADEKVKEAFEKLKKSSSNNVIYDRILYAFQEIQKNVFAGIHIKKQLIPSEYIKKYNAINLWKFNLPKGWRLLYTIKTDGLGGLVAAIILEFMDHKTYERRIGY